MSWLFWVWLGLLLLPLAVLAVVVMISGIWEVVKWMSRQ
jgi:hypothetical protein